MDFLSDLWRDLREIAEVLRDILESLFGYGDYDRSRWRWDRRCRRWVLRASETDRKWYNCTEYTVAKIEGRPPAWDVDDHYTTETEEIEERLRRLGWERRDEQCRCGCGPGESRHCVVLYVHHGVVFHAAIFDETHCDWGGKESANGPIVRYKRPEDYLKCGSPPAGSEMRFYCPRTPPAGPRKSDEWLHDNADSQTRWLECPDEERWRGSITLTRSGWTRAGARRRAGIAAARKVIDALDEHARLYGCPEGCEKVVERPPGTVSASYSHSWLFRWQPWECTATYTAVITIRCVRR